MKKVLKFEGEYRLTLNNVVKVVAKLIEEDDLKVARRKVIHALDTVDMVYKIAETVKRQEEEEEKECWYVHYCTIGEDDIVEASEGFTGPYTNDRAYHELSLMEEEKTICGQNYYYNLFVLSKSEKEEIEKRQRLLELDEEEEIEGENLYGDDNFTRN